MSQVTPQRVAAFLLVSALVACSGGGGGGPAAGQSRGSIAGSVQFAGATTNGWRSQNAHGDAEPNDDLFQVQDLGTLAGSRELTGQVGGEDRADFFRFDLQRAGAVRLRVRGGRLTTFVVSGGTGLPLPVSHAEREAVALSVAAGDHVIFGIHAGASRRAWRVELRFSQQPVVATMPALTSTVAAAARSLAVPVNSRVVPGEVVLRIPDDEAVALQQAGRAGLVPVRSGGGYYLMRTTENRAHVESANGRAALADVLFHTRRSVPQAASVEPNYVYRSHREPNDSYYVSGEGRWHHEICNMPKAWDITTGTGVVVAVLDTGVVARHQDLRDNVLATDGYDFVDNDNDAEDPLRAGASYHGSHVAGIIAAMTDNQLGVAGACWNAKVLPLRVLNTQGAGSVFSISQALLYAAGLPNQSGRTPQNKARIINLSLGGPQASQVIQDACARAQAAGAILVASAGNDFQNGNPTSYPAAYPDVIGVGSIGPTRARAYYSNTGGYVDIAAPGGDQSNRRADGVLSTVVVEQGGQFFAGFDYMQGTSMAAPFASGVIALMVGRSPNLTAQGVLDVFARTAVDLGASGRDDEFGLGLIDAAAALGGSAGGSSGLQVSSRSLTFTAGVDQQVVQVTSSTGAALPLTLTPDAGAAWLTARLSTNATPADLEVQVVRTGLAVGTHRGTLTLTSGSATVAIEVSVTVDRATVPPPAAARVMLFDGNKTLVASAATSGDLKFSLRDVVAGEYTLRIGHDANGNGSFDDAGDWKSADRTLVLLPGETLQLPTIQVDRVN